MTYSKRFFFKYADFSTAAYITKSCVVQLMFLFFVFGFSKFPTVCLLYLNIIYLSSYSACMATPPLVNLINFVS